MIQKNKLFLASSAIIIALGSYSPAIAATTLKGETASPGCPYTVFVMTAKYASREGVNIQVSDGKTLTKSMLKMAQRKLDIASTVPAATVFMSKGVAMYKKLGKKAVAMHKKLRGMFSYQCGLYTMILWDNRKDIMTWNDLKGKRIFTGPPSGAAAKYGEDYIRSMTGYLPNKEYTAVRLNWGGGQDAMRNGQLDGYMRPLTVPSALMDELTGIRPVRILSVSKEMENSPVLKKVLAIPGRSLGTLKANTYKGVVNKGDLRMPAYALSQSVGEHVPEDVVYKITKAFWSNIGEIHANNPYLKGMTLNTALDDLRAPLHMGAYKYYKEQGVKVRKGLLPPELN